MERLCHFGLYCLLLPALLVCMSSGRECKEKDSLLAEAAPNMNMPSECVLSCTAHTYREMVKKRKVQTVRFNPTSPSDLGQHCWPTQMKCGVGEHLQHAYIILPLLDRTQGAKDSFGLRPTSPVLEDSFLPHHKQTVVSNDCGLRFDVTSPFIANDYQSMFCVEIVPPLSSLGKVLKCPPFLVTTWQKQNLPPT